MQSTLGPALNSFACPNVGSSLFKQIFNNSLIGQIEHTLCSEGNGQYPTPSAA
jgi:hypothetical protein